MPIDGGLPLPLIDDSHPLVAEEQRRFFREESQMITEETNKLLEWVVIRPSKLAWAAQVLCVREDGILRFCVDWRKLKNLLVLDSGGVGDISTIFTQSNSASRFISCPKPEQTDSRLPLETAEVGCSSSPGKDLFSQSCQRRLLDSSNNLQGILTLT